MSLISSRTGVDRGATHDHLSPSPGGLRGAGAALTKVKRRRRDGIFGPPAAASCARVARPDVAVKEIRRRPASLS